MSPVYEVEGKPRQEDPRGGICHSREVLKAKSRSAVAFMKRTDVSKGEGPSEWLEGFHLGVCGMVILLAEIEKAGEERDEEPVMGSKGRDSKSVLDTCDLREPQNIQLWVSSRHLETYVGSSGRWLGLESQSFGDK